MKFSILTVLIITGGFAGLALVASPLALFGGLIILGFAGLVGRDYAKRQRSWRHAVAVRQTAAPGGAVRSRPVNALGARATTSPSGC